ncbi:8-oxo-dGTP pyrophosphatase MutT, NUDIX family [Monaibacterium marinum]|uniref:8-oxo-dGTP pyrophosphatase MutT, NUDIX family n=1 Tax=Pontivivens marinum TaxID=1690039 RepID=A0A2C9CM57_9RHOB|nr:NUDIX hydrolase [Monaibacterium marinum]SOH92322.1 8-oxo-dGTP pyrophosphatase MutT, NUDIX family [Monaibacterium marinum]
MNEIPIRDAATIILLRKSPAGPMVLMGQRGSKAVFMPNKFVFPGGALDPADHANLPHATELPDAVQARLSTHSDPSLSVPLARAAIRELFEETGQALGQTGVPAGDVPADWQAFYDLGLAPHLAGLDFVFRAVTPAGRPRRFDARFFVADAADLASDPDDFSSACDELSHLHWVSLPEARKLELPFITEVVLAEIDARLANGPRPVPFFSHDGDRSHFRML